MNNYLMYFILAGMFRFFPGKLFKCLDPAFIVQLLLCSCLNAKVCTMMHVFV